jgi:hypothetical protein
MRVTKEPSSVEELASEYLSGIASKALGEEVQVTGFRMAPDPFEFPRFGEKSFYALDLDYAGPAGGCCTVILRVLPEMDAVMMLTGDTEHRELKAFESGLYNQIPNCFHIPYLHVIDRPDQGQYWAFVEDVRADMAALGMHTALPDETIKTILSHLAQFHASFWERQDVLSMPWLMRLSQPVDYFYRCIVDIVDGMKDAAESSRYIVGKWPWFPEGVLNLLNSLPPKTRTAIEKLYREPERLLERVAPVPRTLCHYDFDNRNLGLRTGPHGPQTVVIDWEIVGEGLSSADVIRFLSYQQPPNAEELIGYYLDALDGHLGRPINREEWLYGMELVTIAVWQIVGVLFGVMVSAPSAPVPDGQRAAMKERVYSDIAHVESLVNKYGLG